MATITHPNSSSHIFLLLYMELTCWDLMRKWMRRMHQHEDDDDFFACATRNTLSNLQHHLAYLNDPSTEIHMLQNHPQIKQLFLKYNAVISVVGLGWSSTDTIQRSCVETFQHSFAYSDKTPEPFVIRSVWEAPVAEGKWTWWHTVYYLTRWDLVLTHNMDSGLDTHVIW